MKKLSKQLIKAGEVAFLAMAYTETIRPIVRGYQREILEKHKFQTDDKHYDKEDKTITDPDLSYLLSDQDFKIYLKEVHEKHLENGFNVKFDYCPLLIAESMERDAKRELLREAKYITGIDPDNYIPLDIYKKLIKLTLQLVSPYINAKEVLKDIEPKNYINAAR